jgi:hypothetical protein
MATWRAAKSLLVLLDQYNKLYPNRSKASDGTIGDELHAARASDHNPDVNGIVHALDVTHDPAHGLDTAVEIQKLANSRDTRIKYLIANKRILEPTNGGWVWKPYIGTDPHTNHMHISVNNVDADDPTPWNLNKGADDMIDTDDKARDVFLAVFHDPGNTVSQEAINSIRGQSYATVIPALTKYAKWHDQNDKLVAYNGLEASKASGTLTDGQKKGLEALEALKEALK